jgi:hypothetical protein
MGTDFRKLKAPSSWYDLVSVSAVLSKFSFVHLNPHFQEMISLMRNKQDEDGFITPDSVYMKVELCLNIFDQIN